MKILLIGNYLPDRQESMLRYGELMRDGLLDAGHEVTLALPESVLNRSGRPASGLAKWVGYLDKYVFGLGQIQSLAHDADVVHVCDHSNAVYVPRQSRVPYVVTCHDLLAVRGARGEDTDCPASATGRLLQQQILAGLGRAAAVACVSGATLQDATRLMPGYRGQLSVVPNAFNYPYRRLDPQTVTARLEGLQTPLQDRPYVLNVGSNHRRKNREALLHAVAHIHTRWPGRIVLAGVPLTPALWALASSLGIRDRLVEVVKPDCELLEALYNGAQAMVFPSRFEGFGWPLIEAQACGSPVICSDRDPFPEVTCKAAIFCGADDIEAYGRAILEIDASAAHRRELVHKGLENAAAYSRPAMVSQFVSMYESVCEQR